MYLVSRTETFAKLFFIVSFTGLFMYVALAFYSLHTAYTTVSQVGKYDERFNKIRTYDVVVDRFENDLKYILVWSTEKDKDKLLQYEGQTPFIEKNCPQINCYITANKTILNEDYANFDAIVFNMSLLWEVGGYASLPKHRTKRQKYVFFGMQPSESHPICNIHVDNFFNWTWTYKFDSEIFTPFIEVRDLSGKVVAPSRNVIWTDTMTPVTRSGIEYVKTKTKAVAWVVDECKTKNYNMLFIPRLKRALKAFNLTLDVYGCGHMKCPKGGCLKAIQRDYYFYLAYEESITEDYVSADVLKGYHYDAVPIVFGGADYSKFLPDDSYINFQFYTEEKLAALLDHTIRNPTVYNKYFNWKKYYTIHEVDTFKGYCDLCELLNDRKRFKNFSTYEDFRTWWYHKSLETKCLPNRRADVSELKSYILEPARF